MGHSPLAVRSHAPSGSGHDVPDAWCAANTLCLPPHSGHTGLLRPLIDRTNSSNS